VQQPVAGAQPAAQPAQPTVAAKAPEAQAAPTAAKPTTAPTKPAGVVNAPKPAAGGVATASPFKGPQAAKVTIMEISDFQ